MTGMLQDRDRVFTNLYGLHDWRLDAARRRGAWNATAEMIAQGPEWIAAQIKAAGLRGRGGAGVSTALKWSLMAPVDERPRYLVVNADESEPGACKDREIIRNDPQLLIEGCLIAARACDAHTGYIYIRGEYVAERERLEAAILEAYTAGLIGGGNRNGWDFDLHVTHGGGAYVAARTGSLVSDGRTMRARRCSASPATSRAPVTSRRRCPCPYGRCSKHMRVGCAAAGRT